MNSFEQNYEENAEEMKKKTKQFKTCRFLIEWEANVVNIGKSNNSIANWKSSDEEFSIWMILDSSVSRLSKSFSSWVFFWPKKVSCDHFVNPLHCIQAEFMNYHNRLIGNLFSTFGKEEKKSKTFLFMLLE